jgi:hypothetical protein
MFKTFADGLSVALPTELFAMFSPGELEHMVSGSSVVDVSLIKQCTEYEDIDPSGATVERFWEVLMEMTNEEKTQVRGVALRCFALWFALYCATLRC